MKHYALLTIASLLSMLLFTFHLADDIVRGFEPGGFKHITGAYPRGLALRNAGACRAAIRLRHYPPRSLLSVALSARPHERGGVVGGRIANSSGKFFWVWTLLAVGVTAFFSVILAVRGLWSLRRSQSSVAQNLTQSKNV